MSLQGRLRSRSTRWRALSVALGKPVAYVDVPFDVARQAFLDGRVPQRGWPTDTSS